MSSARYLEFDSHYRDRNLYPLQSNFIIEMSQSSKGDKFNARDPVSDASPILYWNNSFMQGTGANYIYPIYTSPGPNPGEQNNVNFQIQTTATGPNLKQTRGFYIGSSLTKTTNGLYNSSATGAYDPPLVSRRIIDYLPINNNNAIITLESALPDNLVGTKDFYIANPTPIPTNTPNSTIYFYIPTSNQCLSSTQRRQTYGLGGDNYFNDYYVMNTDRGEYKQIKAYYANNRLGVLDSPTVTDWLSVPNTNFSLRRAIPYEYGSASNPLQIFFATENAVQLSTLTSNLYPPSGQLTGDFVRIVPTIGAYSPYDITTSPPFDAGILLNSPTNCQTQERRIQKYVYGQGTITAVNGSLTVITLDSNASSLDNEYKDCILTNLDVTVGTPNFPYRSAKIISYNGSTKQVTLDSPLTGTIVSNTWFIRTCILSTPFVPLPVRGNQYEIELFSRDNYNPFVYTGSIVSSQEVVCYEVELLNLCLPNTLLSSSRGGRAIFYPYLYVELEQISSAGTISKNIIYSNNPHSGKALFRAVVDDTTAIVASPFIKIDGDGMVHTVKFKPNDAFRFSVYHSNGEPLTFEIDDHYSPTVINPLCQISACFAFKRI